MSPYADDTVLPIFACQIYAHELMSASAAPVSVGSTSVGTDSKWSQCVQGGFSCFRSLDGEAYTIGDV